MRKLPHILLLFLLLSACTSKSQYDAMRRGLDSLNERNRSDQPFTAADVQPYVDFFDSHGTSNDQLLAYYLLGRSYHEQGEAPMALKYYQQAIECADTTDADCDFGQLSRVYGQMGTLFYHQGLFHEQLAFLDLSSHFAWKGNDTLTALLSFEFKSQAYNKLNLKDSMMLVCDSVYKLYHQWHYSDYAAASLGYTFRNLIEKNDLKELEKRMELYEKYSGFFDETGKIEHGREIYYNIKGYYYLGISRYDSAEFYFRRQMAEGKDLNNQNTAAVGLAELFLSTHQPDSSIKYYRYAYAVNDSIYAQKATEEVERMQAMYDYSRYEKKARIAEKRAEHERARWQWGGVVFFFLVLIAIQLIYRNRKEREKFFMKYEHSKRIISRIENEIEQSKKEITLLRSYGNAFQELICAKEQQITVLNEEIRKNRQHQSRKEHELQLSMAEKMLSDTIEYKQLLSQMNKGESVTSEEWIEVDEVIQSCFPAFHHFIQQKKYILTDEEYHVCVLVRLHITPSSISHAIGKTEGTITNIRVRLLKKLFNEDGKAKTFDNKICAMC